MRVHAMQGDTLDLLCWRHLNRTGGVVEQAYEANPGLANLPALLPHGTAVDLPAPTTTAPAPVALLQLWD